MADRAEISHRHPIWGQPPLLAARGCGQHHMKFRFAMGGLQFQLQSRDFLVRSYAEQRGSLSFQADGFLRVTTIILLRKSIFLTVKRGWWLVSCALLRCSSSKSTTSERKFMPCLPTTNSAGFAAATVLLLSPAASASPDANVVAELSGAKNPCSSSQCALNPCSSEGRCV